MPRRLVPWFAVAAVAVAGLGLLLLAGLRATVLAAPASVTARVAGAADAALVTSAVGLLDGEAPQVRIEVRATSAQGAAFVGVGRAQDVEAFLGTAARADVIGLDGGRLVTSNKGGEASLPDPAGADVWAAAARGAGSASLVWPRTAGQWRFVAASDGTLPPAQVTVTWTNPERSSTVPALVAIGVVLLVAAGVLALVVRGRRGPSAAARSDGDQDDDDLDDDDAGAPGATRAMRSGRGSGRHAGPPTGSIPAGGSTDDGTRVTS